MAHRIDSKMMDDYREYMRREEYTEGTIQKYLRDIRSFAAWKTERENGEHTLSAGNVVVDKEAAARWKAYLVEEGYAPVTVNAMLSSLNSFFSVQGWEECKVKFLKIQRRTFRDQDRDLTRAEYRRLLESAGKQGNLRLALLLETICSTGIRVSEVKYVTVESLKRRKADVSLKGKIRTILLPGIS